MTVNVYFDFIGWFEAMLAKGGNSSVASDVLTARQGWRVIGKWDIQRQRGWLV